MPLAYRLSAPSGNTRHIASRGKMDRMAIADVEPSADASTLSRKDLNMDQPPQPTGFPQPPIQPQVVPEPVSAPPPRKSRVLARLLLAFLLVLGLLGSLALNVLLFGAVGLLGIGSLDEDGRVQEKYFSLNRYGSEKVAILSIEGTILSGEGFFKQQIDHARKTSRTAI